MNYMTQSWSVLLMLWLTVEPITIVLDLHMNIDDVPIGLSLQHYSPFKFACHRLWGKPIQDVFLPLSCLGRVLDTNVSLSLSLFLSVSVFLFLSLSQICFCLSLCFYMSLSVCLCLFVSVCFSLCLSLSVSLSLYLLSVYLSACFCLFVCLFLSLSFCVSLSLYLCLSVSSTLICSPFIPSFINYLNLFIHRAFVCSFVNPVMHSLIE